MGTYLNQNNMASRKSLEELLLEEELLTSEQLQRAIEVRDNDGISLHDALLNENLIGAEDLAAILSVHLNLPYIDLQRHKIQESAIKLVPEAIARKHTLIPLDVVGDSLMVVMANPQDIQAIQDIQARIKMKIDVALGVASDIRRAIDINYRSGAEIEKHIREFAVLQTKDNTITEEIVARTPVAQTVDLIITQAVRDRASDIHIEPQPGILRIRFRIDGTLHDMFSLPISAHLPMVSRIKILADMNIAEQRRPQDGQISFSVGEKQIDIRVASIPTFLGERLALRILDKSLSLFTLPELGLLPHSADIFETIARSPYGLALVGGPTGSGKTTTLYALINSMNRQERNIMTIEDPVEYHFQDINQTQVNLKAGITFAAGLRAIMRHDPNVILVGEIRDAETASIAVQAALTGHLVISSIHANNSVGVIFRLLNLGIEPYLLVSTLIGISTQRMVRRICPHCRSVYTPSENETNLFAEEHEAIPAKLYNRGKGCNLCGNTGFQGRTGIFESMLISDNIRKMLTNNIDAMEIQSQAVKEGLITIKRDGMRKAAKGVIPLSEVTRSVYTPGS